MNRQQYIEFLKRQISLLQWALEEALKEEIPSQKETPPPPTEKQMSYLIQVGYKGPLPQTKEEARKIIENLINDRIKKP